MEAAWTLPACPLRQRRQGSGRAADAVLAASAPAGLGRGVPRLFLPWHAPPPCCEIRFLVLHTYPDGIKAYGHERITTPIGRRGKPVKKLRLIPAENAYAMARYFQGTKGTTVSVI